MYFPKTALPILLECEAFWKGATSGGKILARLPKKHVDFVIADASTLQRLVVVELDDTSYKAEKTQKRDMLVNEAFKETGYPMIRIPVSADGYDVKNGLFKRGRLLRFSSFNTWQSVKVCIVGVNFLQLFFLHKSNA
jgi:hypothetical protein